MKDLKGQLTRVSQPKGAIIVQIPIIKGTIAMIDLKGQLTQASRLGDSHSYNTYYIATDQLYLLLSLWESPIINTITADYALKILVNGFGDPKMSQ